MGLGFLESIKPVSTVHESRTLEGSRVVLLGELRKVLCRTLNYHRVLPWDKGFHIDPF